MKNLNREDKGANRFFAVPFLFALLGGCITVGPDYERPVATDLPKEYPVAAGAGEAAPVAEEWWKLTPESPCD